MEHISDDSGKKQLTKSEIDPPSIDNNFASAGEQNLNSDDFQLKPGHSQMLQDPNTPEKKRKSERVQLPLDPENERLPGGARWVGRQLSALDRKLEQADAWHATIPDRFFANRAERKATVLEGKSNMLIARKDQYFTKIQEHEDAIQRLSNTPRRFAIGEWIAQKQISYHTWQRQRAQNKESRIDAKLEKVSNRKEIADRDHSHYGNLVAQRTKLSEERFAKQLEPLDAARKRIDERMNELDTVITSHEAVVARLTEQLSQIQQGARTRSSTAEQRKDRRERMSAAMRKLAQQKVALANAQETFNRLNNHRRRIANSASLVEGSRDALQRRYESFKFTQRTGDADSAQTEAPVASSDSHSPDTDEDFPDLREEGRKHQVSGTDFVRLWGRTFQAGQLRSFKDIVEMEEEAGIIRTNNEKDPSSTFTVGYATNDRLWTLFQKSEKFQAIVKKVSGKSGRPGFEHMAEKLETFAGTLLTKNSTA